MIRIMTHTDPIHVLLYLIVLLLSIAGIFFSIGAYFAGAIEVIIYAGAIMVLFVFVVMMLNLDRIKQQEQKWLKPSLWLGPSIISLLLLIVMIYAINGFKNESINITVIDGKAIGISLFSFYILAVELISMLLLAGLVVAFHIGRENLNKKIFSKNIKNNQVSNNLE
ncbi:NADH-quinone oxidoreductase subunit J [Pantoea sp. Aalb]|nr:NADH-quinone oxidoreductase subunit J [Pantoea sp. Aalb]